MLDEKDVNQITRQDMLRPKMGFFSQWTVPAVSAGVGIAGKGGALLPIATGVAHTGAQQERISVDLDGVTAERNKLREQITHLEHRATAEKAPVPSP